ncbi:hypothetical protein DFJ58DRAFT_722524 [Suillus subalutaceus]|uniref:uncharacterized protein n=1 Tax=Suillus subalutaceus TaxID=48586 RepID=UPI001B860DF8|nr:uncharacterized protein DFJ58DRAFT_722524 [Suillus subalutaceus]KAG1871775.1 hypothetical protein DFJ58DRAFT_722524 [Suillus subalutaceus]
MLPVLIKASTSVPPHPVVDIFAISQLDCSASRCSSLSPYSGLPFDLPGRDDIALLLEEAMRASTSMFIGYSQRPQVSNDYTYMRSHPFSSVNLDMFTPGIYRDSLQRSMQANQGYGDSCVPEPTPPSHEPSTGWPHTWDVTSGGYSH